MAINGYIKSVAILGTGNVAFHLAKAFAKRGIEIGQIYGRDPERAMGMGHHFKAGYTSDINKLQPADIYFFCLTDDGIFDLNKKVNLGDRFCVHVSGSLELKVLQPISRNIGVFYPLQTLSRAREVNFQEIPICIEANSEEFLKQLQILASSISHDVRLMNSDQRILVHIAAVFASNFSNHMFHIAEQILKDQDIDYDVLNPLIEETAKKAISHMPGDVQTGPAKRKDSNIIRKHLALLSDHPDYQKIYKIMSKSIQDHSNI